MAISATTEQRGARTTPASWSEVRDGASPILVDQGTADEFLQTQLRPELFEDACRAAGVPLTLRWQEGYDHSYYFIATFIGDHIAHHARLLSSDRA